MFNCFNDIENFKILSLQQFFNDFNYLLIAQDIVNKK